MSKQKTTINKNTNISLFDSLTPIFLLVGLLYVNVNIYGDSSLEGSNQFILLIGAAIAFLVGFEVADNLTLGYALDVVTSKLASEAKNGHEILLRYSFDLDIIGKPDTRYKNVRFL